MTCIYFILLYIVWHMLPCDTKVEKYNLLHFYALITPKPPLAEMGHILSVGGQMFIINFITLTGPHHLFPWKNRIRKGSIEFKTDLIQNGINLEKWITQFKRDEKDTKLHKTIQTKDTKLLKRIPKKTVQSNSYYQRLGQLNNWMVKETNRIQNCIKEFLRKLNNRIGKQHTRSWK